MQFRIIPYNLAAMSLQVCVILNTDKCTKMTNSCGQHTTSCLLKHKGGTFNTKEQEAWPTNINGGQNNLPILVCSGKTKLKKIAKKDNGGSWHNRQHLTTFFWRWMMFRQSLTLLDAYFRAFDKREIWRNLSEIITELFVLQKEKVRF